MQYFKDKDSLIKELTVSLQQDDTVLIKASNGMKLFEVAEALKSEFEN